MNFFVTLLVYDRYIFCTLSQDITSSLMNSHSWFAKRSEITLELVVVIDLDLCL